MLTQLLNLHHLCWLIVPSGDYPCENFLTSSLGCKPSFWWHILLEGRNILSLGFRHRIFNGLSTDISPDKWIPTLKDPSPLFFNLTRGLERKVVDLIDYNQCCCREDRIKHLFLHHEAEAIL